MAVLVKCILILLLFDCFFVGINGDEDEKLHDDVFADYNSDVKPHNESGPVVVSMALFLKQLIEVNAKEQFLLLSVWKVQEWEDPHLYWDPSNYSGEDHMHVNEENLWVPDTYLFNTLDIDEEATERKMPAKIFSKPETETALIIQNRPGILKSSCLMNVNYFPWDVQVCALEFGSWSFPLEELDYHVLGHGFEFDHDYVISQEWIVHELRVEREVHHHHGHEVVRMIFEITLWRMPMYYVFNLIIPTIIITITSYMGLFSLSSSSGERGEKVSLGMGTILALAVVMLMVQDSMPNTSLTNPMISWYFLLLIILIASALASTVFIMRVHSCGEIGRPISPWLFSLCRVTPKTKKEGSRISTGNRPPHPPSVLGNGITLEKNDSQLAQEILDPQHKTLLDIARNMRELRRIMKQIADASLIDENEEPSDHHLVAERLEIIGFLLFTFMTLLVTGVYLTLGYTSR